MEQYHVTVKRDHIQLCYTDFAYAQFGVPQDELIQKIRKAERERKQEKCRTPKEKEYRTRI